MTMTMISGQTSRNMVLLRWGYRTARNLPIGKSEHRASIPGLAAGRISASRPPSSRATLSVCSQRMLARIQVLLSDEHRKTRRCKTARFVSALRDQDKRAIRTWVDGVHHARPVTVPPPLIESQKQKSDNLQMDWLQDISFASFVTSQDSFCSGRSNATTPSTDVVGC